MSELKNKAAEAVKKIKKENPNANWRDLVTGVLILVLVGLFSVWYFSNSPQEDLLSELSNGNDAVVANNDDVVAVDGSETGTEPVELKPDETIVEEGEGLWQVAERVCGDPEKYIYIAESNDMNPNWAPVAVGDVIKVDCGFK